MNSPNTKGSIDKEEAQDQNMDNIVSILGIPNSRRTNPYSDGDAMTILAALVSKFDMTTKGDEIRLTSVESRMLRLEEKLDLVVSALAAKKSAGSNLIMSTNTGAWTRRVMKEVLSIYCYATWMHYKDKEAFPVSLEYLSKCIEVVSDPVDGKVRSELGQTFGIVLEAGFGIRLSAMSSLMTKDSSSNINVMRNHTIVVFERLCTSFPFLSFPFEQRIVRVYV